MNKPKSYRIQDGCHNCKSGFDNYKKPQYVKVIHCCYPYTKPPIDKDFDALSLDEANLIDTWACDRYVHKEGICDQYEELNMDDYGLKVIGQCKYCGQDLVISKDGAVVHPCEDEDIDSYDYGFVKCIDSEGDVHWAEIDKETE